MTIFVIGGFNFTLATMLGVVIHYTIQNALIIITLDREFTSLYHYNLLSIILWRALEIDYPGSFIILAKISIIEVALFSLIYVLSVGLTQNRQISIHTIENIIQLLPFNNQDARDIVVFQCIPKFRNSQNVRHNFSINFKAIFCKNKKLEIGEIYEDSVFSNILNLKEFSLDSEIFKKHQALKYFLGKTTDNKDVEAVKLIQSLVEHQIYNENLSELEHSDNQEFKMKFSKN